MNWITDRNPTKEELIITGYINSETEYRTKHFLVCFEDGYINVVQYYLDKHRGFWQISEDDSDLKVIAWMPLPEPPKINNGDKQNV